MKTTYSAFSLLGSQTNTDNESSAIECFKKNHDVKFVQNNKTGEILVSRKHMRCGTLRSGIKFMGNLKVYKCSDTGVKITSTGEVLEKAIKRIEIITKNREFETSYKE